MKNIIFILLFGLVFGNSIAQTYHYSPVLPLLFSKENKKDSTYRKGDTTFVIKYNTGISKEYVSKQKRRVLFGVGVWLALSTLFIIIHSKFYKKRRWDT